MTVTPLKSLKPNLEMVCSGPFHGLTIYQVSARSDVHYRRRYIVECPQGSVIGNKKYSILSISGNEKLTTGGRKRHNTILPIFQNGRIEWIRKGFNYVYSRPSLSRNRRYPLKHFEISVLRRIRFVVLRKNNSNNQISQMTM